MVKMMAGGLSIAKQMQMWQQKGKADYFLSASRGSVHIPIYTDKLVISQLQYLICQTESLGYISVKL